MDLLYKEWWFTFISEKVMAIVLLIPSLMDDAFESLRNEHLKNKKLKKFTEPLTKFMLYVNK